jgi:hypothetical protein
VRHPRIITARLGLSALLIALLILSGQMVATARGLAAQGGPWATLCLGAVTVTLAPQGDDPVTLACPDGILATAAFIAPPPAPTRPLTVTLAAFTPAATTPAALAPVTPATARGPPLLT